MNTEMVVRTGPEEKELARKHQELAQLQSELADRELFLANLRGELAAFQRRYLREVGALYAELDDLSAKIAEWLPSNSSTDAAAQEQWYAKIADLAEEDEQTAEFSFSATWARGYGGRRNFTLGAEESNEEAFRPSTRLKSLYREVAKRVHPDLATNEADRHKRELLVKQANEAYQRGDHEALRNILAEYEDSPESVQGEGVAADLARVIRQIKQIKARLSRIEREIAALMNSDIGKLRVKAEAAVAEGRDLLAEMAADLRRRIELQRNGQVRNRS
jgi:ABC-type phosphate transport system auxiliary subunit